MAYLSYKISQTPWELEHPGWLVHAHQLKSIIPVLVSKPMRIFK